MTEPTAPVQTGLYPDLNKIKVTNMWKEVKEILTDIQYFKLKYTNKYHKSKKEKYLDLLRDIDMCHSLIMNSINNDLINSGLKLYASLNTYKLAGQEFDNLTKILKVVNYKNKKYKNAFKEFTRDDFSRQSERNRRKYNSDH